MKAVILSAFSTLVFVALPSYAAPYRRPDPAPDFYVDVGYDRAWGSGEGLNGVNVAVGYRFGRYFAVEGGFDAASVQGVSLISDYVEVRAYAPINSHISFFGSAGPAFATARASGGGFFVGTSGAGMRVGGGIEDRLSRDWFLTAQYHYQTALANISIATIGVGYRF